MGAVCFRGDQGAAPVALGDGVPPPFGGPGLSLFLGERRGIFSPRVNRPLNAARWQSARLAPILHTMSANSAPDTRERYPCGTVTWEERKKGLRPKRWHEAIIDDMLALPFDTLKARAQRLGYNESTLSSLTNSDMFKAAYSARRQHYAELLDIALTQKLAKLGDTMVTVMQEAVEAKRGQIPFAVLSESTNDVLAKLGFGEKKGPATIVNVQANGGVAPVISAERLTEARNKLRMVENQRGAQQLEAPDEVRSTSPSQLPPKPLEG